jgi:hypothetical protein
MQLSLFFYRLEHFPLSIDIVYLDNVFDTCPFHTNSITKSTARHRASMPAPLAKKAHDCALCIRGKLLQQWHRVDVSSCKHCLGRYGDSVCSLASQGFSLKSLCDEDEQLRCLGHNSWVAPVT